MLCERGELVKTLMPERSGCSRQGGYLTAMTIKTCSHLHSQTTRITTTTISATTIRAPMIPPTIPPTPLLPVGVVGVFPPSTRKNMSCHLFLYTLNCHHMYYSLVGLGVSVWEVVWGVVWGVVESKPWDEKIGVRFYSIRPNRL